jgi:hypothetical protein
MPPRFKRPAITFLRALSMVPEPKSLRSIIVIAHPLAVVRKVVDLPLQEVGFLGPSATLLKEVETITISLRR